DYSERETFIYTIESKDDLYIILAPYFSEFIIDTFYTTWFNVDGKIQLQGEVFEGLNNLIYGYRKELKKLIDETRTIRNEIDVVKFFNKVFVGEYKII